VTTPPPRTIAAAASLGPRAAAPAEGDAALLFVADDAEVERLDRECAGAVGPGRTEGIVRLAWHLRQRDGRRAGTLAEEALAALPEEGARDGAARRLALRLLLVEAEVHWQFAEFDAARACADRAVTEAALLGDLVAGADAHWILATIANDIGDMPLRDASFGACEAHAEMAGDLQRVLIARAAVARWAVFTDPRIARERWADAFGDGSGPWPPGVSTWVLDFLGNLAFSDGDYSPATMYRLRMHEDAIATGQWQRAIVALTNIGACFSNLNDHETGLGWMQRGLDEARRLGWPAAIAGALLQVGGVMQPLGRLDAAREMLTEARSMPGIAPMSRNRVMAAQYLGEVLNAQGEYAQAIELMLELEALSSALQQSDMLLESRLARASSMAAMGRLDEAIELTESTLEACWFHQRRSIEILTLLKLARLHAQRREQHPEAETDPGVPLGYLHEALSLSTSIEGYQVTGELYDTLASEHAHAGDFRAAYEASQQAARARERTISTAALNRSIAMQIAIQTERARADAEHHRSLADTLQQTTSTLERLSAIGQEITRQLDERAVFDVLARHVDGLLDAAVLSIWRLEEYGARTMHLAFGVEQGRQVRTEVTVPLDHPSSNVARCARTGEEIVRNEAVAGHNPNQIPGTLVSASVLFAPLTIGERRLGVMSIQSPREQAYGERERLIFRTLCAYGAIALDNSRAYRRLGGALDELQLARDELAKKNELLENAWRQQQEASLTDPLTQLRNRRFLMAHIEDEVALTLRRQEAHLRRAVDDPSPPADDRDLVFFMVDIDHFKSVNDLHGHAAGDRVLVQVAQRLREVARETDYLIRWGGEEFLIVARATHAQDGPALAERLRQAIGAQPFDIGDAQPPIVRTCSIGFAGYPFHPQAPRLATWSEIARLADQALYVAKAEGRNRWVGLFSPDAVPTRESFEETCHDPSAALLRGHLGVARGGA
jgi:diguanylate cyclase (GGDEF)-like protein